MTATGKLVYEETAEDNDVYFRSGRWEGAGGCIQSLSFCLAALEAMQGVFKEVRDWSIQEGSMTYNPLVVHDYGCALGDGTALLQAIFPFAEVKGFDFSSVAVEMARERWKTLAFEVGDIKAPAEDANIIWTSHTLEHQEDPATVVEALLERCGWLVVVVPDINPRTNDGGHFGAEITEEWLARLPAPVHDAYYITPRKVPEALVEETGTKVLFESNVLRLWKGKL